MNGQDPLSLSPLNNSKFKEMKQLMACKAFILQRIIQEVHKVVQKSCRRACQLFCCPVDTSQHKKIAWHPDENQQFPEDNTTQASRTLPSTILIVNISNSTLIDCVIGNKAYPSTVAETQPLMQKSERQMHHQEQAGLRSCSCSRGQQGASHTFPPPPPLPLVDPRSISIHSSNLSCVIIGDNNYMHVEQTHPTERDDYTPAAHTQGTPTLDHPDSSLF